MSECVRVFALCSAMQEIHFHAVQFALRLALMNLTAIFVIVLDRGPESVFGCFPAFSFDVAWVCRRVYCNLEVLPSNYQVCFILQPPSA